MDAGARVSGTCEGVNDRNVGVFAGASVPAPSDLFDDSSPLMLPSVRDGGTVARSASLGGSAAASAGRSVNVSVGHTGSAHTSVSVADIERGDIRAGGRPDADARGRASGDAPAVRRRLVEADESVESLPDHGQEDDDAAVEVPWRCGSGRAVRSLHLLPHSYARAFMHAHAGAHAHARAGWSGQDADPAATLPELTPPRLSSQSVVFRRPGASLRSAPASALLEDDSSQEYALGLARAPSGPVDLTGEEDDAPALVTHQSSRRHQDGNADSTHRADSCVPDVLRARSVAAAPERGTLPAQDGTVWDSQLTQPEIPPAVQRVATGGARVGTHTVQASDNDGVAVVATVQRTLCPSSFAHNAHADNGPRTAGEAAEPAQLPLDRRKPLGNGDVHGRIPIASVPQTFEASRPIHTSSMTSSTRHDGDKIAAELQPAVASRERLLISMTAPAPTVTLAPTHRENSGFSPQNAVFRVDGRFSPRTPAAARDTESPALGLSGSQKAEVDMNRSHIIGNLSQGAAPPPRNLSQDGFDSPRIGVDTALVSNDSLVDESVALAQTEVAQTQHVRENSIARRWQTVELDPDESVDMLDAVVADTDAAPLRTVREGTPVTRTAPPLSSPSQRRDSRRSAAAEASLGERISLGSASTCSTCGYRSDMALSWYDDAADHVEEADRANSTAAADAPRDPVAAREPTPTTGEKEECLTVSEKNGHGPVSHSPTYLISTQASILRADVPTSAAFAEVEGLTAAVARQVSQTFDDDVDAYQLPWEPERYESRSPSPAAAASQSSPAAAAALQPQASLTFDDDVMDPPAYVAEEDAGYDGHEPMIHEEKQQSGTSPNGAFIVFNSQYAGNAIDEAPGARGEGATPGGWLQPNLRARSLVGVAEDATEAAMVRKAVAKDATFESWNDDDAAVAEALRLRKLLQDGHALQGDDADDQASAGPAPATSPEAQRGHIEPARAAGPRVVRAKPKFEGWGGDLTQVEASQTTVAYPSASKAAGAATQCRPRSRVAHDTTGRLADLPTQAAAGVSQALVFDELQVPETRMPHRALIPKHIAAGSALPQPDFILPRDVQHRSRQEAPALVEGKLARALSIAAEQQQKAQRSTAPSRSFGALAASSSLGAAPRSVPHAVPRRAESIMLQTPAAPLAPLASRAAATIMATSSSAKQAGWLDTSTKRRSRDFAADAPTSEPGKRPRTPLAALVPDVQQRSTVQHLQAPAPRNTGAHPRRKLSPILSHPEEDDGVVIEIDAAEAEVHGIPAGAPGLAHLSTHAPGAMTIKRRRSAPGLGTSDASGYLQRTVTSLLRPGAPARGGAPAARIHDSTGTPNAAPVAGQKRHTPESTAHVNAHVIRR